MRGNDGSMWLYSKEECDYLEDHLGVLQSIVSTTFYMDDGRVVTYTPEPLRLTYSGADVT
jgi:hypothetical protein